VKVLYFDCFAGAAGDMILGALIDAGLPFDELKRALGSLAVDGWQVSVDRVLKAGITASKFSVRETAHAHGAHVHDVHGVHHVHLAHDHGHRSLNEISQAIDRSSLSERGKSKALKMFRRLGEAEAAIHGMAIDQVHLHEVGAIDSIVDIVGAVFALEWFKADRVVVSPLNVGGGMVTSAHGVFPVPAPATLALLQDAPVYSSGIQKELLTPTGALILTEYADEFGPIPAMTIQRVGYGAGDRELKETPNVVRVVVGEAASPRPQAPNPKSHRVCVLECEIDDMNPQIFGALMGKLYEAGALDVFYVAVQMKKNRPGTLLTIIATPEQRDVMSEIVFRESTTIGIRHQELSRECLDREMIAVNTTLGPVRFKVASRDGRVLNAQPEFDDLAKLSEQHGIPIKDVQALSHKAWLER